MNNYQNQNNQQNNQQQTGFNTQGQQTNSQQPNQQANQQPPSMVMKLLSSCLPVILEQFTGQSVSPMGGNAMETQLMLSQILTFQQQIIANQQDLNQRLVNLEISASQQLTNLDKQVQSIKSIRLSHSKETKEID